MNIIINADDFGISAEANQAIAALHKKKVISSATLLVDLPESKAAADLAKRDKIPVGLHFNLTLNNEHFQNRGDFERKLLQGKVKKSYVRAELARQYQKMLDFGLKPTHLDSHQHIHNWPQIFPIFAKFAREKKLPVRLVLEKPIYNKYDSFPLQELKHLRRKIIALCFGWWNLWTAKILRVKTNRNLISIFALCPAPAVLSERHLRLLLKRAPENSEYMCHPLTAPENTRTAIAGLSVQEYNLMTNPEFFAMLANKINLSNYGEL
jgi:predicted glycoside hydrolase/deacetylase ChbG (UPF0249 family)